MSGHTEEWIAERDEADDDGSWIVTYTSEIGMRVLLAYGLTEKVARTIAAAPMMKAALEAVGIQAFCSCFLTGDARTEHKPDCWVPMLRDALAKSEATGR